MAINYEPVGWDTTKYFNPTNMNHMDGGIKSACDKADANEVAIADVNSKLIDEIVEFIPSILAHKIGHTIEIYTRLSNLEKVDNIKLGNTQYKSVNDFTILPLYSIVSPYLVVGSLWIYGNGIVEIFKPSEATDFYISGNYIFR